MDISVQINYEETGFHNDLKGYSQIKILCVVIAFACPFKYEINRFN